MSMLIAQPALWWLGYLAIGGVVGTFAGMLGVGGGLLIIPSLTLAFEAQGFPREHVLHVAIGTAMASTLFTSLSSTRAHAVRQSVRWDIARSMTPGILIGSLIGATLAEFISTRVLTLYFAAFALYLAVKMAFGVRLKAQGEPPGSVGVFAASFVISGLCSLLAMGGAMLTVPFMLRWRIPLIHAIGTAAAVGFPIALGGTAGYILSGWDTTLPRWSIGYVYLPALVAITFASVLAAPLGARIAHHMPGKVLQLIFSTLLLVLAGHMLVNLW
jgi:uncharacterized membrane protein YfcA